jgi:hypothetical protein
MTGVRERKRKIKQKKRETETFTKKKNKKRQEQRQDMAKKQQTPKRRIMARQRSLQKNEVAVTKYCLICSPSQFASPCPVSLPVSLSLCVNL